MNHEEILQQLEQARIAHLKELERYRSWYLTADQRSEDGFEQLERLPEGVFWVLEQEVLWMKGTMPGLQTLTYILKAFAHDEATVGLFYQDVLLLKQHEPAPFEGLTVIAMPDEAWAVWGGKMVDVAWGNDFPELTFNELGFFEETLPTDLGICLLSEDRGEASRD
ncbi:hypothetical protein [Cesiribacter andamanensis]|uniref:Uncharacterized protein n=1 Tax=Cesiribacter andamanensis AMV16 TaxID=1279009 RepID=M7N3F1_9BACT|nr:hypothetical protein [Cesiribacter andamanensis]EMR03213.1 hypothetical protein ADICEAN_01606 [Cesiribacter andamanensis AMV16]